MQSLTYKLLEFFLIFIVVPVSFVFNYPIWLKMAIGATGFLYIIYVLLRIEKKQFKIAKGLVWNKFWKQTIIKFIVVIIITTIYVWIFWSKYCELSSL